MARWNWAAPMKVAWGRLSHHPHSLLLAATDGDLVSHMTSHAEWDRLGYPI